MSRILFIARGSSFLQQTFVSIGKVLPAILAPTIVAGSVLSSLFVGIDLPRREAA